MQYQWKPYRVYAYTFFNNDIEFVRQIDLAKFASGFADYARTIYITCKEQRLINNKSYS